MKDDRKEFVYMLFGIMVTNFSNETQYVTELAKAAQQYQTEVCRFTPLQIDVKAKEIQGEIWDTDKESWESKSVPLPDFVYDRSFYGLTRETTEITEKVNWLKEQSVFLGYGLPSKWEIYKALKDHPLLQAFLPKTVQIETAEDIWKQMEDHERIVLKPSFGSRGTGIYLLEKTDAGTSVTITKKTEIHKRLFQSKSQLNKWVDRLLQRYSYLCQPYLELATSKNEPFDLRILMQKNKRNQWVEKGRGIRLGQKNHITANIATGGLFLPVTAFIQQYLNAIPLAAEQTIHHILRTLPEQVEATFHRLFELGIDLGVDQNGKVWILDINSKPGRKIIEVLYPNQYEQLYHSPILYSQYLAHSLLKAGE